MRQEETSSTSLEPPPPTHLEEGKGLNPCWGPWLLLYLCHFVMRISLLPLSGPFLPQL